MLIFLLPPSVDSFTLRSITEPDEESVELPDWLKEDDDACVELVDWLDEACVDGCFELHTDDLTALCWRWAVQSMSRLTISTAPVRLQTLYAELDPAMDTFRR